MFFWFLVLQRDYICRRLAATPPPAEACVLYMLYTLSNVGGGLPDAEEHKGELRVVYVCTVFSLSTYNVSSLLRGNCDEQGMRATRRRESTVLLVAIVQTALRPRY